jgi:hypothetical protein
MGYYGYFRKFSILLGLYMYILVIFIVAKYLV